MWVHLVAAGGWFALTGERAPSTPVDADAYINAGLPWFDYYDAELQDVAVSATLAGVKTVGTLLDGGLEHAGTVALPPGDERVVRYGGRRSERVGAGDWGCDEYDHCRLSLISAGSIAPITALLLRARAPSGSAVIGGPLHLPESR